MGRAARVGQTWTWYSMQSGAHSGGAVGGLVVAGVQRVPWRRLATARATGASCRPLWCKPKSLRTSRRAAGEYKAGRLDAFPQLGVAKWATARVGAH